MPPERKATAQNWFLLRGLVRETADWSDFPAKLKTALPGANVFCLDLPGNGRHFERPAPLRLSEMVDFTRQEFQKLRAAQPKPAKNYLLAISLGAMAAIDWLQRYPDEIDGAVLINTSLRGLNPFYQRLSPGSYPTILRMFLMSSARRREEAILRMTSSRPDLPAQILEERTAAREQRPVSRTNAVRQILAALRTNFRAQPPKTPLLLLNSLGDKLVHPRCSETLQALWNVPMQRHAWANHDLPLDDPQWTIEQLKAWLASLPDAASPDERSVSR